MKDGSRHSRGFRPASGRGREGERRGETGRERERGERGERGRDQVLIMYIHVVYGILHVHVHVHACTCTCMDIDTTQSAAVCPLTAASWFTDTEC